MNPHWTELGFQVGGRLAPGLAAALALRRFLTPRRLPPPPRELAWRAGAQRLTLPAGPHRQIAAWSFGPPEGRPVLLVHGWEGRGTQLGAFAAPLVARGLRAVAIDLPAHGDSPGTQLDPGMALGVLRDLDGLLGPFAGIVAHSFGGACAALALADSDGRPLRAERAVLIASPSSLPAVARFFARRVGLPARAQAAFLAQLQARGPQPYVPLEIAEAAFEPWRLAPGFRARGLVMHDPADADVPFFHAEAIAGAWPGAVLWPASGFGHRRVLRAPAAVARVAEFFA